MDLLLLSWCNSDLMDQYAALFYQGIFYPTIYLFHAGHSDNLYNTFAEYKT